MGRESAVIGDYVSVREHPTVVRLADLDRDDAAWLSESFVITPELEVPLAALGAFLRRRQGAGAFLIGHYGSGKTHLLAYLTQQLRSGDLVDPPPRVVPISLVNHRASSGLEEIVAAALGIDAEAHDRRSAWRTLDEEGAEAGILLILDELSEFLRSKPDRRTFNEDVRFLQFMGEWARDRPLWIIAAMQESIEHTGELEYSLYRKIKDRYPLRLMLTPAHVETLIAEGILIKRPGFREAVDGVLRGLARAFPGQHLDVERAAAIYPVHPATLELLEAVRDRFSQARGVVDFVVGQLRGDAARSRPAFLEAPWGRFLTPERIVDHFRDLFELEPEFLAFAQRLFPWYERHLGEIFESAPARELAERLVKLLVLVSLAPGREVLHAEEAAAWLLFAPARIDPERNRAVVARTLATLATRGRYVAQRDGGYCLDLADDGAGAFDASVARAVSELASTPELVLESLVGLLPRDGFNPFTLERERWLHRQVRWHFHERRFAVWLGDDAPEPTDALGVVLRLPWGEQRPVPGLATLVPRRIEIDDDLLELAALARFGERAHSPQNARRLAARMERLAPHLRQLVRNAWLEARLVSAEGREEPAPRLAGDPDAEAWLAPVAIALLRRTYPSFERFAPTHGPLPRDVWRRFLAHCFGGAEAWGHDAQVELVHEGYLVPMGLVRRSRDGGYAPAPNVERHELVRLLLPLLEHGPSPARLYEHLALPVYGLVPDQVGALLLHLSAQGVIDIRKGGRSLRDAYETLPDPRHYDRVLPARALSVEQREALARLARELGVALPKQWSALAERRIATEIASLARVRREYLEPVLERLDGLEAGRALGERLRAHIAHWRSLEGSSDPLAAFESFLSGIGSISAFLEEARESLALGERLPALLGDVERFRHLLQHPLLADGAARGSGDGALERLVDAVALLGEMPRLERLDDLATWLAQLAQRYERYKDAYRHAHDAWWREAESHPLWRWRAPALAASRHAGLAAALAETEAARAKADRARCRRPSNLDFQPLCVCGFDGPEAPARELLDAAAERVAALEQRLTAFFAQPEVRHRILAWREAGLETSPGTLEYLDGRAPWPDITDVAALDRHLAGLELTREVDESVVTELLRSRAWEPEALLRQLAARLASYEGRRLRFRAAGLSPGLPGTAAEWMARQMGRHGEALPEGLDTAARAAIGEALRAEWIAEPALGALEGLGLRPEDEDRIAGWLLDGTLPPPGAAPRDSLAGAIRDLLDPAPIDSPHALAVASRCAYRLDPRLQRLAGSRWRERLEALARTPLPGLPPLVARLREEDAAQWLVVDCAGLPLLEAVERALVAALSAWRPDGTGFALVGAGSSTDDFYRELLDASIRHALEKVNVVDELVHEAGGSFLELEARVGVELGLACRRVAGRFDPGADLLVFADHGFRLSPERRHFVHGGGSTLERVVPLWRFASKGR